MKRLAVFLTASAISLIALNAVLAQDKVIKVDNAKPAAKKKSGPEKDVEAVVAAYVKAFNEGDVDGILKVWAPDGDSVGPQGKCVKGRDAMAKRYGDFFTANPQVKMKLTVDSVKFIGDDVALVDTTPELSPPLQGPPVETRATVIMHKQGGKWLVESVRDAFHFPPSNYEQLKQLEWLIGDWKDAENDSEGIFVESTCGWTVNKNFIIRKFTAKIKGEISVGGTQLIGWDPREQEIRSWVFDSSGEFAHAVWRHSGNSWIIESTGVRRDGSGVSSTNIVTLIDDNTFTFESRNRKREGKPEADIPPITVKRCVPEGETQKPRETILPEEEM